MLGKVAVRIEHNVLRAVPSCVRNRTNPKVHSQTVDLALDLVPAAERGLPSSKAPRRLARLHHPNTISDLSNVCLLVLRRLLQSAKVLQYTGCEMDVDIAAGNDIYTALRILLMGVRRCWLSWQNLVLLVAEGMCCAVHTTLIKQLL